LAKEKEAAVWLLLKKHVKLDVKKRKKGGSKRPSE